MFIATRVVVDIATGHVLLREGSEYVGLVAWLKGASQDQENLAKQQAQFYQILTSNYNTQFADQKNILNTLTNNLTPIISAGINQYGFNPAEDAALRTTATEQTATAYSNASKALSNKLAAQGGGDNFLPSGVNGQFQQELATASAADQASKNLSITEAGYQQGRNNYNTAASILGNNASLLNPNAYASNADSGGNNAFNSATTVQKMNNAASPWGAIGGILGGVAGSFLGPFASKLGGNLAGKIGGPGVPEYPESPDTKG